ncbi:fibronectin type III domain-containing protein [candidate division KSB1 bacterium]
MTNYDRLCPKLIKVIVFTCIIALSGSCSDNTNNPILDEGQDKNAPAAPTNLTFLSVGNGEIHLRWDENTEPDIAGYRLYRAEENDLEESYTVIFDSLATSYIDKNLEYTTRYFYRISAYDNEDNESDWSESIPGIPQNTQPPNRPQNFSVNASNIEAPVFRLMWNQNSESDLEGYKIFRGSDSGTVNELIDSTADNFYEDLDVDIDMVYYYKILAYDKGGEESAATDADFDVALSPATLVSPVSTSTNATPTFIWQPVSNTVQYKIFIQTSAGAGEFWSALIDNTQTTIQYSGPVALESGKTYWWKVATITKDPEGLNSISNTASFTVQ